MTHLHLVLGIIVVVVSLGAAGRGLLDWRRRSPSRVFRLFLRTCQATVVAQVALGLLLVIPGTQPPTVWHPLVGVAALAAIVLGETARAAVVTRMLESYVAGGLAEVAGADRQVVLPPQAVQAVQLRETLVLAASSAVVLVFATLAAMQGIA